MVELEELVLVLVLLVVVVEELLELVLDVLPSPPQPPPSRVVNVSKPRAIKLEVDCRFIFDGFLIC